MRPLAIKYRPINIDEFVGQKNVVKDLKERFKQNAVSQNILLIGPSGTGKTTLEHIIAKHLLCSNIDENGNSCNKCEYCLNIDNDGFSDFYFKFNASNIDTQEARNLTETALLHSWGEKERKVFIIDELQELARKNKDAAQNLLMLFESPPKNVYFIMGAMETKYIPSAIIDRFIPYFLKPLKVQEIAERLAYVCEKEKITLNEEKAAALVLFAENAQGSMRKALDYLERAIFSDLWDSNALVEELELKKITTYTIINKILSKDFSVFEDIEFNREVINDIRYKILLIMKKVNKIPLKEWEYEQIKNIKKTPIPYLMNLLNNLNTILFYPYPDKIVIETKILEFFLKNQQ